MHAHLGRNRIAMDPDKRTHHTASHRITHSCDAAKMCGVCVLAVYLSVLPCLLCISTKWFFLCNTIHDIVQLGCEAGRARNEKWNIIRNINYNIVGQLCSVWYAEERHALSTKNETAKVYYRFQTSAYSVWLLAACVVCRSVKWLHIIHSFEYYRRIEMCSELEIYCPDGEARGIRGGDDHLYLCSWIKIRLLAEHTWWRRQQRHPATAPPPKTCSHWATT